MGRSELNLRTVLLLLGLLLLAWLLYLARGTVVLLGIALMLMATLHPLVLVAERRGLSHSKAVTLVMLALVLVPLALLALLTPLVISEVQDFADSIPHLRQHIDELLRHGGLDSRVNAALDRVNVEERVSKLALVLAAPTLAFVTATFEVVVIAGYLLADSQRLRLVLHEFVPRLSERHIEPLLAGMERVVGGYIRGQLITSSLFGVFGFLLCLALGVPYPLLLGIVAAIGDIIPLFGVQVAMVITALVALTNSTWQPLAVLVGYVIYGQLESHLLVPRIYARTVNLSPLLVIVATVFGAKLYGIVGIFISIPTVGVLKVIFDYVVAERVRGREQAQAAMLKEPTDQLGAAVTPEMPAARNDQAAAADELAEDGIPAPTYSPFESVPSMETSLFQRFLSVLGLSLGELEARFARELERLSPEERLELVGFTTGTPEQLSEEQQRLLQRMLSSAVTPVAPAGTVSAD